MTRNPDNDKCLSLSLSVVPVKVIYLLSSQRDEARMSREFSVSDDKDPRFYTGTMVFGGDGERRDETPGDKSLKPSSVSFTFSRENPCPEKGPS